MPECFQKLFLKPQFHLILEIVFNKSCQTFKTIYILCTQVQCIGHLSTYNREGANDVCSPFKRDPSPLSQGTLWHLRWQIFCRLSGESQETDLYTCVLCEYLWKRLVVRCFCFNPFFTELECSIAIQLSFNLLLAPYFLCKRSFKNFYNDRTKKKIYKQLGMLIKQVKVEIFVIQLGKSKQTSFCKGDQK